MPPILRGSVGVAGVEDLFVHIMVANQAGLRFYTQHGFDVVAEESANAAHYRHRPEPNEPVAMPVDL